MTRSAAIATPIACWRPDLSISSSRSVSSPTTWCALVAIIEGAGGRITTWQGTPATEVAASSLPATRVHKEALAVLRGRRAQ